MAIRISRIGRDFKAEIEGTTFTLRRLTPEQETAIMREHSKRGSTDYLMVAIGKLEAGVVGWDQIIVDGEPIGYDRALIREFPDELRVRLLEELARGQADPLVNGSKVT